MAPKPSTPASGDSNLTPTSDQSREDEEDEEEDVKPTISSSESAVLFLAPLEFHPFLNRYIASKLASSSSDLKVLDGASVPCVKDHHAVVRNKEGDDLVVTLKESVVCGESGSWKRNLYDARFPKWTSGQSTRTWTTIEVPSVQCLLPRVDLFRLFEGCRAVFSSDIDSNIISLDRATTCDRTEQRRLLQLVFEALGGKTLGTSVVEGATHFFSIDSSKNSQSKVVERHGKQFKSLACLHPFWISSSISHGFLLPLDLFRLEETHPLTGYTAGSSEPRLLQQQPQPPAHQSWNKPRTTLFEPFGVVFPGTPSLLTPVENQIFAGRTFFFAQASEWFPYGSHPQLIIALTEIATRLGGKVSLAAEKSNWIVVGRRMGKAYSHGLANPKKILGTVHHFLAHLSPATTEIIDVASNWLYYPHPNPRNITLTDQGPLSNVGIFISDRYRQDYRRYLVLLARVQGATIFKELQSLNKDCNFVIAPTRRERNVSFYETTTVLPQFIEKTFQRWDLQVIFNVESHLFVRESDRSAFLPSDEIDYVDDEPSPIPAKVYKAFYGIESRWDVWSDYVGLSWFAYTEQSLTLLLSIMNPTDWRRRSLLHLNLANDRIASRPSL